MINVVQVGISLENMMKTLRRFDLIMAAVFPLGLLLAGGGGWLLARRALRPVDRMTQAVPASAVSIFRSGSRNRRRG